MEGQIADNVVQHQVSEEKQKSENEKYAKQVHSIVAYYLFALLFLFWLLFDTWSNNFFMMRILGVQDKALAEPLLRTIGFTIIGGAIGSILYHIRVLFFYYAKAKYDSRWFGKYLTAPLEGSALAVVVLSLIRGGVALFGGTTGTEVTATNNFSAFGIGALVGFVMRDVVTWLVRVGRTMFPVREQDKEDVVTKC